MPHTKSYYQFNITIGQSKTLTKRVSKCHFIHVPFNNFIPSHMCFFLLIYTPPIPYHIPSTNYILSSLLPHSTLHLHLLTPNSPCEKSQTVKMSHAFDLAITAPSDGSKCYDDDGRIKRTGTFFLLILIITWHMPCD